MNRFQSQRVKCPILQHLKYAQLANKKQLISTPRHTAMTMCVNLKYKS